MYERSWEYISSNGPMFRLTGQDLHLLDSPLLVDRSKLLAYVGRERMDDYNVFTVEKHYTDDAGRRKQFMLVLKVFGFRETFAVVSEAVLTDQTGYRKYSPAIGLQVLAELKAMEAPREARLVTEGNTTRVLRGLSDKGTFIFDEIVEPSPEEATLLVHHEGSISTQWIYRYGGHLYHLITSSRTHKDCLTKEQFLDDAIRQPLCRYAASYHPDPSTPDYIVVNGMMYNLQLGQIRFCVHNRRDYPTVDVLITDEPASYHLRTFAEVRAELEHYLKRDEVLAQFKYVHPDLEGDPIPDIHEGLTVMIAVKDPNDPRAALNGALGKVVSEHRITCSVQFLGYAKFTEEFHKIDLIPLNSNAESNEY